MNSRPISGSAVVKMAGISTFRFKSNGGLFFRYGMLYPNQMNGMDRRQMGVSAWNIMVIGWCARCPLIDGMIDPVAQLAKRYQITEFEWIDNQLNCPDWEGNL